MRSRIGPLALEAPLGNKGSKVFRAVHVQQKMQVAVRIYPVPFGMTPESKKDFAEQMELLKKLRHPGIVRCYGGGFDQRDAYLVYELVDGESLEKMLDRRQRLPWEVVLDYGIQLSDALQVAHDSQWYHGRIRPDKLVLTADGAKIKIADFRRDWAASNLFRNATKISDLAYCAPEQLNEDQEEPIANVACDLYSLGAVLYHMLTGRSPFVATQAADMKQSILKETLPPVASVVLDCPIWLNAIIEQLLEKDPNLRLYSAAAVSMALKEAHKRATLGTSVAQHAVSGFSPLQLKSADRQEAEKVLGRKKVRERVSNDGPAFYERAWFLVVCLLAIGLAVGWAMMPLSERQLRDRAEKLLASKEAVDANDAKDRYLSQLIERFPESENADWAKEQIATIDMNNAERRMERNAKLGREATEAERRYLEARRYERFDDRLTAAQKYTAIIQLMKDSEEDRPVVNLARRQLEEIKKNPPSIQELRKFLLGKIDEAEKLYDKGDVVESTRIYESIVSLYNGNVELKPIVEQAQSKLRK